MSTSHLMHFALRVRFAAFLLTVGVASNGCSDAQTGSDISTESGKDMNSGGAGTATSGNDTGTATSGSGGESSDSMVDQPCSADSFDHDADAATDCRDWTSCVPGQYVVTEGTADSNRICAACPQGSFSAVDNASDCTEWTSCEWGGNGSRMNRQALRTVPAVLPRRRLLEPTNALECAPWTSCDRGQYVVAEPTAHTDRVGAFRCPICHFDVWPGWRHPIPSGRAVAG